MTNNLTELLAAVLGMESMPANWDGTLYTDSQVTLYRVERRSPRKKAARMNGIPSALVERLNAARNRLGNYSVILLGGHPTYSDLALGHRPDGLPVSQHNVHTDKLCNLAKEKFQITSGTRL